MAALSLRRRLGLNNALILLLAAAAALTVTTWPGTIASQIQDELLPHPCDHVKCPAPSEITCPDDSDMRDISLSGLPVDLLQAITAAPPITSTAGGVGANVTTLDDELYAQCCLVKKCICKTCYIPECHADGDVVVELQPESMDTPGQCCGLYDCQQEPNCTAVRDTAHYWLTDCQRCKCYSGERMCHQSCDEGAMKKPTAICQSKTLNSFFEHGEVWKDGCYECECVNGEEKCVMPFCRSLNCPPLRQIMLKDSCCPICWPNGAPMPGSKQHYDDGEQENQNNDEDDEGQESGNTAYDDEDLAPLPHATDNYGENEIDPLPHVHFDSVASAEKDSEATTGTTTAVKMPAASASTAAPAADSPPPPCVLDARADAPATYQVYPEVVEVVRQTHQNDLLYVVIACLTIAVVGLIAWNIHLRHKQRSYRPVSNFDDNFNKMSSNIKKTNDYV